MQALTAKSRGEFFDRILSSFQKELQFKATWNTSYIVLFFSVKVSICLLFFQVTYVLQTYLSLFFTKRFCSTPSMRFLKHWSRTSRLLSGWLVIKVALSSLKYYDSKAENIKNEVWKFKPRVTHLHPERSGASASHVACWERSLADSTQRSSWCCLPALHRLQPLSPLKSAANR